MMEQGKVGVNERFKRYHERLKKGNFPKKGMTIKGESGERGVPIIEEIVEDKKTYEIAINLPNDKLIENLPRDLVIECPAMVDKDGVHGIKRGNISKPIAAILRIEASVQDVCVDAILKESKDLAIACIAMDVNCGSFKIAEEIFNEMIKLQKDYLPKFK
jgi:alpha-galactosidase